MAITYSDEADNGITISRSNVMRISCDYCHRIGEGTLNELKAQGWCIVTLRQWITNTTNEYVVRRVYCPECIHKGVTT